MKLSQELREKAKYLKHLGYMSDKPEYVGYLAANQPGVPAGYYAKSTSYFDAASLIEKKYENPLYDRWLKLVGWMIDKNEPNWSDYADDLDYERDNSRWVGTYAQVLDEIRFLEALLELEPFDKGED